MLGKDLVNFIQTNKLEEVEIHTHDYEDEFVWSVYPVYNQEIEYSWFFDGSTQIRELIYPEDEDIVDLDERILSTEEALKLRGLAD